MDSPLIQSPRISVLMPVYNCEVYVKEALESILEQTFEDFELLIIDDASTDGTLSIIKSYNDQRIKLIEKPHNTGYTNSLNYGLQIAKGEYIARMDGDDISMSQRLAKQLSFMDSNPEVVLCGTTYEIIKEGKKIKVPENDEEIKLGLLRGNCFAHSTVMFRKSIIDNFSILYDTSKEPAEDYDLWVRLIPYGKMHNLQEALLKYRLHYSSVSRNRFKEQAISTVNTRLEILKYLNVVFQPNEERVLKKIFQKFVTIELTDIENFQKLKKKLAGSDYDLFFKPEGFQKYLLELEDVMAKKFIFRYTRYSPAVFLKYLKLRNSSTFKISKFEEVKLLYKSLLFWKI